MTDPYYQNGLRKPLVVSGEDSALQQGHVIHAVSQMANRVASLIRCMLSCTRASTSTHERAEVPVCASGVQADRGILCLGAGAKGISYWWYNPGSPSNGLGAGTPDALRSGVRSVCSAPRYEPPRAFWSQAAALC